jgi:hypothetical protein
MRWIRRRPCRISLGAKGAPASSYRHTCAVAPEPVACAQAQFGAARKPRQAQFEYLVYLSVEQYNIVNRASQEEKRGRRVNIYV